MGKDELKVVLDTNVILSVLLFGSRLEFIRMAWKEGKLKLLFSEETLEELVRVLHYPKFGLEGEEIDFLIYVEVLPYAEVVREVVEINREICRDDLKFLKCAVSGGANFIVGGDKDILSVKEIEGVRIITPAELRKFLK
ncbi:putative PIN family toxin of toxin-antitoxin system [Hydrogenivirga caldilitoris]|uniref:Putative PIN family toxin of toxin-antitoxin system n=1 Tax=Hydrogenivirga caldilitoris TaxID=246264 RepID=A0A497XQA9_9AQUI|nr:putative toxin-antitoxin system toxin component, PIN family [Hydrogenivirga caldilitoris]RLJ70444.1 putative PIN family toxin of toxin-antitoxin system [Hydrogenivirga caldilitoris]